MKKLITEEDYRNALCRFIEIMEKDTDPAPGDEVMELIEILETYEYENC